MKLRYQLAVAASIIAAFATAIPGHASKANLLGYYSVCSFVPASTLICLAIAGAIIWLGHRRSRGLMAKRKPWCQGKTCVWYWNCEKYGCQGFKPLKKEAEG